MATKSELIRPLSTRRAFDEVSDQIRALIYSGALTPGDKLPSEHELASQFNAGRMVIREALRGLEEAGLIVIKQGRTGGAFVNTVNAEAITRSISDLVRLGDVSRKRLTEARRGIERVVLELALRYMTPEHLAQLEANVAEAEALILAGENPLDANAAFHVLLAKATDNLLIASMVESMMAVSRLFGRKVPYNEAFRMRTLNFHKEILEALRQRDLRRAEQAMEQHLEDQDCMAH